MALVGSISGSAGLNIGVTGSVIFSNKAGSNGSLFPATLPGGDVYFFVSGSTTGKDSTAERTVALFGGDVAISGTLYGGSPLKIGDSVGLTGSLSLKNVASAPDAGTSEAVLYSRAGTLYFKNAGGSETAVGSGGSGGGTNFFLDSAGIGKIYTTASSVAFPFGEQLGGSDLNEAADKGSDVKFYVSGSGQVVGVAGSTVSLFGGNIVTSGSLEVKDSGGSGTSLTLSNAGSLFVGGDIDVISAKSKTIFSSIGSNTITVGGSSATVVVPGNLTVNGTTTTINTDNLLVRDAIIMMASGTAGPNKDGGIAIFSGSDGGGTPDLVFGKVANDVWGAGKISTNNGTITSLTTMTPVPIRAGAFQVGSATAYVSSSDTQNLIVNSDSSTTFANSGGGVGALVQIGALNTNEGAIFGQSGTPGSSSINRLWVSGTRVDLAHSLASADNGVGIVGNDTLGGLLRITKSGATPTFNIEARDGSGAARILNISGSQISVGASDANGTVTFARQGSTHLTITSDAANNPRIAATSDLKLKAGGNDFEFFGNTDAAAFLKFTTTDVGGANNALISGSSNGNVTLGSSGTGVTTVSGSVIIANGSTGGLRIQRDGSNVGALVGQASNNLTISAYAGTAGPGTGTSTQLFLSGSEITLGSNTAGVINFARAGAAHLHIDWNGTTTTISGALNQNVTLGAGKGTGALALSGSAVAINSDSTNGISFQKDGSTFAKAGVTPDNITGLFPNTDSGASLGSPQRRWANVYTGDLHLRNDRGNWTIIEEEEYLSITNNISGKRYKFVLEEI